MSVTFYGLKSCDTCRRALKELAAADIAVRVLDVRADGVPADVMADLIETHGEERIINRKSTTWRSLDDAERKSDAAALLAVHPTLMKRPVIIMADGSSHVGWDASTRVACGLES